MPTSIMLLLIACLLLWTNACLPASATDEASSAPSGSGFVNSGDTGDLPFVATEMNGVRIGLPVPPGWAADIVDGLIVAEHLGRIDGGMPEPGLLIYAFVPPLDQFNVPAYDSDNVAYHVLNQVVRMPTEIGANVVASAPTSFSWGTHDAAYYLLNSADQTKTLVLAVEIATNGQLLVINLSAPGNQVERIRALLPLLMDGVQIDDDVLSGRELDQLPTPLRFPTRDDSAGIDAGARPVIVDVPSPAPSTLTPRFLYTVPSAVPAEEASAAQP